MAKKTSETDEKMKTESKYDPNLLREMILAGADATEIMEKLGIKHKQTLKQYVLKLINQDKTFYDVRKLYLKDSHHPTVNKKGELKINLKNLKLPDLTVSEGDQYSVEYADGKIILTRV